MISNHKNKNSELMKTKCKKRSEMINSRFNFAKHFGQIFLKVLCVKNMHPQINITSL